MLEVVVRLKERHSLVELKENATNAPDVARMAPAQLKDHLGRPVVARTDNRTVVLVVKGGRAKVNQPNGRVLDAT